MTYFSVALLLHCNIKTCEHRLAWVGPCHRRPHLEAIQGDKLPQRNSASAAHVYLGWLTDRTMHRIQQNRRQTTRL